VALIKIYKKLIPSFRHRKTITIFDNKNHFISGKKHTINNNYIKRKKYLYTPKSLVINKSVLKFSSIVTKNYYYITKPYKKFIVCQTIDNFKIIIPGIEYLNVGKVLYSFKVFESYNNLFFYKGFLTYLYTIPNSVIFCNLTNLKNDKITYGKSGGTFCKTKKTKKTKKKLLTVILPSQNEILLSKMSKAYIGKNENFRINDLVEGK
jgi:hypothetical protein